MVWAVHERHTSIPFPLLDIMGLPDFVSLGELYKKGSMIGLASEGFKFASEGFRIIWDNPLYLY
jgi:hypothetical protein